MKPIASVTGYYGGRCVVEPLGPALVLPRGMALYAESAEPSEELKLLREAVEWAREYLKYTDTRDYSSEKFWETMDKLNALEAGK